MFYRFKNRYISRFFRGHPSMFKFLKLLNSTNKRALTNLCLYIKFATERRDALLLNIHYMQTSICYVNKYHFQTKYTSVKMDTACSQYSNMFQRIFLCYVVVCACVCVRACVCQYFKQPHRILPLKFTQILIFCLLYFALFFLFYFCFVFLFVLTISITEPFFKVDLIIACLVCLCCHLHIQVFSVKLTN